jgi:alpha-tubulin suppressor-like RCC1 family protein
MVDIITCRGHSRKGALGLGSELLSLPDPTVVPITLPQGDHAMQIHAGFDFTALLTTSGSVYTWGDNKHSQLGITDDPPPPNAVFQPRSVVMSSAPITSISLGWTHGIALLSDSSVLSWGRNNYGQRGLGHTETVRGVTRISLTSLGASPPPFVQVAAGSEHCGAIDSSGVLYMWGWNEHGNLGLGHCNDVNLPTPVVSLGREGSRASNPAFGGACSIVFTQ